MGLQCPYLLNTVLVSLLMLHLNAELTPVITKQGSIFGTTFKLTNGQMAYKYLGIPYAEPPLGMNRFREPKPSKWKGNLTSKEYKKDCPQKPDFFPTEYTRNDWDEDCLYLNVFTPMAPSKDLESSLPVMVYIHEGGFLEGSGRISDPHKIMEKNVILVTFNYRLGALGFLSTGKEDKTIPGNFGLFDQKEVLIWVQDNIHHFGGNKSAVTLIGCGAGGASAAFFTLCNECKGLFSAAILQSGTALNWWSLREKPEQVMKNLALRLNCTMEPHSAMLECLWHKPPEEFISIDYNLNLLDLNEQLPNLPFAPVVDGDFITEDPKVLMSKLGKWNIPIIVGVVKDEASVYLLTYEELKASNYNVTENFLLDKLKAFDRGGILGDAVKMAIKFEYVDIKSETEPNKWRTTAIELGSDAVFTAPAIRTIQHLMKTETPVYMYTFEYATTNPFNLDWLGAYQSSEKNYILGLPETATDIQKNISELMATYWTNFAKFGNPSPDDTITKWDAVKNGENINYLKIGTKTEMDVNYRKRKVSFWNEYIEKLYSITEVSKPPTEPSIILEYNKFRVYQGIMILMTILTVLLMILLAGVLFHKYKGPPVRRISRAQRPSMQILNAGRISQAFAAPI